ncbi:MAG: 2,3-bisphosphoglycerate-independent phosphoglycerate mutase [Phycisphaeraceae bacterium]|nr:2,3-bisphosphoglycerate-independent phosphoglycerate mutase [Phycisphaeraceae bacterium]MCB9847719.1 2,3-bisphosphoglycerate-independent phosphoglycerate mutase [Phycisphaeraceae bacterium]
MTTNPTNAPLLLVIRDGWGRNPHPEQDAYNAVKLADTPVADALDRDWPSTLIKTSGEDVGLESGRMGNSEVGHQNIGAGRVVDQDAVRISKAARLNSFKTNQVLSGAIAAAASRGGAVHLMGIASDAGVHGLLEHLYACLDLCKHLGAPRVYLHCFTDGRDAGPFTGRGYVEAIEARCRKIGVGEVASVIGRYWAMDRDNRWERVARAYTCLTGQGARRAEVPIQPSATGAIQAFYDSKPEDPSMAGDEFVTPTMIGADITDALARRITNNDTVIYYNYRGDRPRELVSAFVLPDFEGAVAPSPDTGARGFERGPKLNLRFVGMTPYSQELAQRMEVAFPKPPKMVNILGSYVSGLGLTQFRCAETEKFPHVTFFFNDYRDEPFPGERRVIVQSPKVATYDQKPEMSAAGVRDAVLERLRAPDCEPLIVVNFANPDMVGHTGNLPAVVKAVEITDACVGALLEALENRGGCAIVTADHGNAEQMWNPETNAPHTSHTTYDVPLYVVGAPFRGRTLRAGGRLADIAPTALAMLGIEQPPEMTGVSLLD